MLVSGFKVVAVSVNPRQDWAFLRVHTTSPSVSDHLVGLGEFRTGGLVTSDFCRRAFRCLKEIEVATINRDPCNVECLVGELLARTIS